MTRECEHSTADVTTFADLRRVLLCIRCGAYLDGGEL